MRRRLVVYTLILTLLIALLPGLTGATGSTPAIAVVASSTHVATGQTFDLSIQISGASNVYGSSVDLIYDSTLLEYVEGSAQGLVTDGLTADQYFASILNRSFDTPARLSVIAIRLGRTIGGASGDGNLASFRFKALREGQATFTINGTSLDVQMVDPTNAPITYSASSTGVTVQIGPAPAGPIISGPAQGAYLPSRTVEVSGTAPASSVVIPSINGSDQATVNVEADGSFSFPLTVGSDGVHTISVRESTATTAASQTVFTVDTLNPVLGPITATAVAQSTISGMVTEANLDKLFVQVNPTGEPVEADAVTVESDGSYSANRVLAIGSNTIRVTALDKAGNTAMTTNTVDVADTSKPTLSLISSAQQIGVDATFTVAVQVANPNALVGADLTITYPTSVLEVVDAQPGTDGIQNAPSSLLGLVLTNSVNPEVGAITYVAATTSNAVETDGTLLTITFKAIASGSAQVSFTTTEIENAAGPNAAHFTESTEVNVASGGTVTGQVSLAGRGANARAGAIVKVVGHPISAVTAADGSFTLQGVPAGAQKLLIRFPNPNAASPAYSIYLAQVVNVDVTLGSTVEVPLVAMKGGDANGDGVVSLSDLVILAKNYGLNQSSPGYDARADFTGDSVVSLSDLVVLAGAYGSQGAAIPEGE